MVLNSRSLALLIAIIVATLTALSLSSLPDVNSVAVLIGFVGAFVGAFIVCFIVLEFVIFSELRKIYSVFEQFRGVALDGNNQNVPIKKMSAELFKFANTKEQEIEKLKQLETFRKEFLADISHELKTPIFSAQGFISTLQDGAIDDEEVRDRFLEKASKSLDELDHLVHDLLSISQLETGEFLLTLEDFDVLKTVKQIFEQLEVKAQTKNVTLKLDAKKNEVLINADRVRIEQVIKNLVVNAINYGFENGEVVVQIKTGKEKVEVCIIDNGPGISLEHQDKIFRRFYRIDKSRSKEMGGTGLGLSIVKHIIEAHDSKINLVSKVGKGTTFSFKLEKGSDEEN